MKDIFQLCGFAFQLVRQHSECKKYKCEPAKTWCCTSQAANHTKQRSQGIIRPSVISKATFDLENCQLWL